MDHPRDLLLMVNHFRAEMPRPIMDIGHSFGGCQMLLISFIHVSVLAHKIPRANIAYLHPRLFTGLVLMDPVIRLSPPLMGFGTDPPGGVNYTTHRKDIWPTREAAAASQAKFSQFEIPVSCH